MLPSSLRLRASQRIARSLSSSPRNLSTSAPRHAQITLEIDGVQVEVEQGSALIQACEKAGTSSSPSLVLESHLGEPHWRLLALASPDHTVEGSSVGGVKGVSAIAAAGEWS